MKKESDYVWVKDTGFELLPSTSTWKCRRMLASPRRMCPNRAVVALKRSNGWWNYCEEHMYGRRIKNGIIEYLVANDSPAAKQGYI